MRGRCHSLGRHTALTHDGYSAEAVPNGTGSTSGQSNPANPQVLNQMNVQRNQVHNYKTNNDLIEVDALLMQETGEVLHRLRMEEAENRALSRHEEIISAEPPPPRVTRERV